MKLYVENVDVNFVDNQEAVDRMDRDREGYWGFDGEKITFDSERYREDFRRDLNEVLYGKFL